MRVIPTTSHIYLEEGEEFLGERQDPDNICRTSTIRLPTGCLVTVQRHFSQIGPEIFYPDGRHMITRVRGGVVVEWVPEELEAEGGTILPDKPHGP